MTSINKTRFLIVGCGGRECIIVSKLVVNHEVYVIGEWNNPVIIDLIGNNNYCKTDNIYDRIISFCRNKNIDIIFIGPEKYINDGLSDLCWSNLFPCIAPTKIYSLIECSKSWSREFINNDTYLKQYNPKFIYLENGTISYGGERGLISQESNTNLEKEDFNVDEEFVIKCDGLKGGKGVYVQGDHFADRNDGIELCNKLLKRGESIVLENKFNGEEFSLFTFSDGDNVHHSPPVQDYKRAYDDDKGANTGGMGSVTVFNKNYLFPFLTDKDRLTAQNINTRIIHNLKKLNAGIGYIGILYGSFMKTVDGIKIIEFNCRFGDSEVINILELLENDLGDVFRNMINQNLDKIKLRWKQENTIVKYIVPNGYPDNPIKNVDFIWDDCMSKWGYCASISRNNINTYQILGSRSMAFCGKGKTINSAIKNCDAQIMNFIKNIKVLHIEKPKLNHNLDQGLGQNLNNANLFHWRKDIGFKYDDWNMSSIDHMGQMMYNGIFGDSPVGDSPVGDSHVEGSPVGNGPVGNGPVGNGPAKDECIINDSSVVHRGISYKSSGVDIDKNTEVINGIKDYVKSTYTDNFVGVHGGFGGKFKVGNEILVSSTDGVGTKSIVMYDKLGNHGLYFCGYDIVNHCINDILVEGAFPLFFLDYYASANLKVANTIQFVKGCSEACKAHECVLIGGETAEMPDVYKENKMDLVGTIVGIQKINMNIPTYGDYVIYFNSSGPHTNGYSLIRKCLNLETPTDNIMRTLLKPHRCYLDNIKDIITTFPNIINGMCHITGGGIENIDRILPSHLKIDKYPNDIPEWCKWIQKVSCSTDEEMFKTFNMGIGFLVIIDHKQYHQFKNLFKDKYNLYGFVNIKNNLK